MGDLLSGKEKDDQMEPVNSLSTKDTILGCLATVLIGIFGLSVILLIFWGPGLFKDHIIKPDEAIFISGQYNLSLLVMIFIILWIFACIYWVRGVKRFLTFMTVPFTAYILLFFNYHIGVLEGIHKNSYFQLTSSFVEWGEMDEVAFIPDYTTGRKETTFNIKLVYMVDKKSYWVDSVNLEDLLRLKELLEQQGDVPVFIYPLDKGDLSKLEDVREENNEYYKRILDFIEVKDIRKYPKEHILVNESFY
ncbi:hypothetical protein [Mangrovibacillus cuniculi]|uniref:Uncharacterized protein n=1 Tax=Mangrovibacillus cuniculi TaxID=2593652 RepID=A0A7S8CD81_9BACI|nr:hypothetical protein [Mangrovibacillus cuniculi]QPC47638.1 hypothetical protein G8O30_12085 [Mangrovibacillus cuniculi]